MNSRHTHSAILFPLLTNAAALHTLFLLFVYRQDPISDHAGILIWWGCLALTYGILTLLLRRPRSLQPVILTAAAGFLLQLVLNLIWAQRPPTVLSACVLLSMWAVLYARCCGQLLEGTNPESVATVFEASVLMLFIAAFGVSAAVMTPASLLHTAAGTLLALVAMARLRTGHVRVDAQPLHPQKGRLLLIGLLAALGGIAAAFCILLTGSASRLLSRFTQWAAALFRAALAQADRLVNWLLSFLPEYEVDPALLAEAEAQAPSGAAEWGTFSSALPFYLMLGALTILALGALIWLWRHGSFHRIVFRSSAAAHTARRRRSLRAVLSELRQRLCRWISFRVSYLRLRNTAPGLFVWLERQMRLRHLERRPGETSRAFLTRVQDSLPACSEPLTRLATCLDLHYFGSGQTLSAGEISAMRRQIQTELHDTHRKKAADL